MKGRVSLSLTMRHAAAVAGILPDWPLPLPSPLGNPRRQEEVYLRRRTARIKLSKYAAYNTYHHCEQCHLYMGFSPRYQVRTHTHTYTHTHMHLHTHTLTHTHALTHTRSEEHTSELQSR